MKQFSRARRIGHAAAFHARGITLIELMVVTAIVAILAAIAYPSYQRYVARTHRNAAAACLSQMAQVMERRYTTNLSYELPGGADNAIALGCQTESGLDRFYAISLDEDSLEESEFTVQAVPTQAQEAADIQCGTLTINQAGVRDSENENNNLCW